MQPVADQTLSRTASFVAMSRFVVANGMVEQVRQAFADRPRLVEQAEGFLGMEVLRPIGHPEEFWLVTRWTEERFFLAWHRSDAHHQSHRGIPKGLKLVPKETRVMHFERIAS
jgi:heme oxygenase (mycobilin-producing)